MTKPDYIHGSQRTEQRRLSKLNDLLNRACLDEFRARAGESVLDVGSGLGQFSRCVGRLVGPRGRVVGIERDPKQLAEAQRQAKKAKESELVEWRQGDATALPLEKQEWGNFDVAHTRFVLEHVPKPEKVVAQMVRAVRRGGRVILADDDHQVLRLWPEPSGFDELWRAYIRAYEHLGCDPFVGRRLTALLERAGARPVRSRWIFFGSCAGEKEFPLFVQNLIGVILTAEPLITGPLQMTPRRFRTAIRALEKWGARRDAAIWYALCWAEGKKE